MVQNSSRSQISIGSLIQSTYRIDSVLGEGGMGTTYLATHIALNHKVAVKVIGAELSRNSKALSLFKREAHLMRGLTLDKASDALVRIETLLSDSHGNHFLIMEYVTGEPLSHYVKKGARLSSTDIHKLAERLLSGLNALHQRGIIHRDISPDNIMVPDGDISQSKILDFGLASDSVGTDKSILGDTFAGKLNFAAPEQLGLFGGDVTSKSDLYSLGVVLMSLSGAPIAKVTTMAEAISTRAKDIDVSTARVDERTKDVLRNLLRADPKNRSAPVGAYAVENTVIERAGTTGSASWKTSIALTLAAALLLIFVGGGAYYLMFWDPKPPLQEDVQIAAQALEADDPLSEARSLVDTGGSQNLNAALGALMKLEADQNNVPNVRADAAIMIAKMYDSEGFNSERSPFPTPNDKAALRFYKKALNHGNSGVQPHITRLSAQ